jgi:hypothetical protein
MKEKSLKLKRFSLRIPPDLWLNLKKECLVKEVTLTQLIIEKLKHSKNT